MSEIIKFFVDSFMPLCEATEGLEVDISTLIEASKNSSPVVLNYADKDQSEKDLAIVIILNFCNTYADLRTYPKKGIQTLNNIISKKLEPNVIAQQMLLVHVSKMKYDVSTSVFFVSQINQMQLVVNESIDHQKWKQMAKKAVQHSQINHIINQSIVDFGLVPASVDDDDIKISFVTNVTTALRGFIGFNEIFINVDHFADKFDAFKGDIEILQLIAKIDIISVAIHEYSHVKIRKSDGNFNMSSPFLAQLKNLKPNEFGMYNEERTFNLQVDWFRSARENLINLDVNYIERFVKAIEDGTVLPTGNISGAVSRMQSPGMGGADIQLSCYVC